MNHAVVGGWELSYGMMVAFPNRGSEGNLDEFLRNYPDISFDFVKPHIYWARIENVRRYQDKITFCTWDSNGTPIKLSTPHNSVWIIKEQADMSESNVEMNLQVSVDAEYYEKILMSALETAFENNDAESFDETIDRLATHFSENPERFDSEDVTPTFEGIKIFLLTQMMHGVFEGYRKIRSDRPRFRPSKLV